LPQNASNGKAIIFLKRKWHFMPQAVMVAGDSGNDQDMLCTSAMGLLWATIPKSWTV